VERRAGERVSVGIVEGVEMRSMEVEGAKTGKVAVGTEIGDAGYSKASASFTSTTGAGKPLAVTWLVIIRESAARTDEACAASPAV
jgi:hypothetical protein